MGKKTMCNISTTSLVALAAMGVFLASCKEDEYDFNRDYILPFMQEDEVQEEPANDVDIREYDGQRASDAYKDVVGTDEDFYWEANTFTDEVTVTYSDAEASVTSTNELILCNVDGAYVTVDMLTNSVKGVKITVSGSSSDGQLKIYGDKKFMLSLEGVDLTCQRGPAVNSQCKKRAFVHLEEGTSNYLTDASSYTTEPYYHPSSSADSEDRKGCFFSEGNLIFSGSGVLCVTGKNKHGIATDGYLYTRPGVTLVVYDAAKNAINVKGDSDDGYGIYITGGLIYAATSATAGKSMKTDQDVVVTGGELYLYTSGGSEYDSSEGDTSSPSGIKADGSIVVSGGHVVAQSTGTGGKGLSADVDIIINDGNVEVQTTGKKYTYNSRLTSSPKGIKADGNIEINGGTVNVSATGTNDGSEGVESKAGITINDGELSIYACDDAMNASSSITINGGKVYCYSTSNDGIDSNGSLTLAGGLVIASGTTSPEEGIDCDSSNRFIIRGGTIIGTGGSAISPSSSSTQRVLVYSGFQATSGNRLCILSSSGTPILVYDLPRTMSSMSLLFSSPSLVGGTYSIVSGCTLVSYADYWNGWYSDCSVTGGSTLRSFTSQSTITTVSGSGGGGGDIPGGGGDVPNIPGGIGSVSL